MVDKQLTPLLFQLNLTAKKDLKGLSDLPNVT